MTRGTARGGHPQVITDGQDKGRRQPAAVEGSSGRESVILSADQIGFKENLLDTAATAEEVDDFPRRGQAQASWRTAVIPKPSQGRSAREFHYQSIRI